MKEPYWWYVLYVRTNTEHKVVDSFQKVYESKRLPYVLETFCPESERYYKDKQSQTIGKTYRKRPLFPGYVFIETNMPANAFQSVFFDAINSSSDIIRLLRYGESGDIALQQHERQRFEYLFRGNRCIEHSIGYIEGDKIIITGGPLIGMEGNIKKINRHHRSAKIEIDMFNQKQLVDVTLEIVHKDKFINGEGK